MEWIYTENKTPICYKKDDNGLMNSDIVLVEDESHCKYLAYLCEGKLDGCDYHEWFTGDGWCIDNNIIRWLAIPE